MKLHFRCPMRCPILSAVVVAMVLVPVLAFAQSGTYTPGEFQTANPNYPKPDPFYFEGKIDWNLLGITQPQSAWDYLQRGIHYQDDLNDIPDAMTDYQTALSMNSLQSSPPTCSIVTLSNAASLGFTVSNGVVTTAPAQVTPAPCMFTIRLRLGYLLQNSNPAEAIELFGEVLQIDPQRLGVNTLIAETYVIEAQQTTDTSAQQQAYANAVTAYQAELALSPVTAQSIALTDDMANNSKVHWELAQVYQVTGQNSLAASELQLYLQATQWHSDVYPWRIALAKSQIQTLARAKK
jgi:tetratricopeptide (TPR) repeat protein